MPFCAAFFMSVLTGLIVNGSHQYVSGSTQDVTRSGIKNLICNLGLIKSNFSILFYISVTPGIVILKTEKKKKKKSRDEVECGIGYQ